MNAKLSAKKTNAQNQNVTTPGDLTRVVRATDSKASARKMLQFVDLAFRDTDVTAVPPLSPPSLDGNMRHSE